MSRAFEQGLARFINAQAHALLRDSLHGLEKETLRVNSEGVIAQTAHPQILGSALTHPYITTDYSEALLEFITPPQAAINDTLGFLQRIHSFVYPQITHEMLWTNSMPCVVAGDDSIPIARYGRSNAGRMKHLYRIGLGLRYGKTMQVIAGIHYNFSFGEPFWDAYQQLLGQPGERQALRSERYFALMRNLFRVGWLIPYLFGASPAVCKSFLAGRSTSLPTLDPHTYYVPEGTSLRLSDIGYTNASEKSEGVQVSYNSLEQYVTSLQQAISTPCPRYAALGVKVDDQWRQLNANRLQIENEYYSTLRPKQILQGEEKPSHALWRRGVRYIELRSLDIDPFEPLGVSHSTLYFLQSLILWCLLEDSAPLATSEREMIDRNLINTARMGRARSFVLERPQGSIGLRQWGLEILDQVHACAELLDADDPTQPHQQALALQRAKLLDPELTPSARVVREMREQGETFFRFAQRKSLEHQAHFRGLALDSEHNAWFEQLAEESLRKQGQMEASDRLSFDQYLAQYFAQTL